MTTAPKPTLSWRAAIRIAWREMRASRAKFLFVVPPVASGVVKLNPPRPLREALDEQAVVVSDDLLVRLNVRTGDMLHIGGQDFRIAGVMVSEPDRMTGSLNVGPRVMISRAGLDRTGLITP